MALLTICKFSNPSRWGDISYVTVPYEAGDLSTGTDSLFVDDNGASSLMIINRPATEWVADIQGALTENGFDNVFAQLLAPMLAPATLVQANDGLIFHVGWASRDYITDVLGGANPNQQADLGDDPNALFLWLHFGLHVPTPTGCVDRDGFVSIFALPEIVDGEIRLTVKGVGADFIPFGDACGDKVGQTILSSLAGSKMTFQVAILEAALHWLQNNGRFPKSDPRNPWTSVYLVPDFGWWDPTGQTNSAFNVALAAVLTIF